MTSIPIPIPPEALEAGKDSAFAWLRAHMEDDVRVQEMTDEELTELVSAACIAVLKSWPGQTTQTREVLNFGNNIDGPIVSTRRVPFLILPLPQENSNAK